MPLILKFGEKVGQPERLMLQKKKGRKKRRIVRFLILSYLSIKFVYNTIQHKPLLNKRKMGSVKWILFLINCDKKCIEYSFPLQLYVEMGIVLFRKCIY